MKSFLIPQYLRLKTISMNKEYRRQYAKKRYLKHKEEIAELRKRAEIRKQQEIVEWRRSISALVELTSDSEFRDWFNSNSKFPWYDGMLDDPSSTFHLMNSAPFRLLFEEFLSIDEFKSYLASRKDNKPPEKLPLEAVKMAWRRRYLRVKAATPAWFEKECVEGIEFLRLLYNELFPEDAPWHIDHIIPIAGENVCGLHVHTNMQLLPWRENIVKSNKFDI